MTDNDICAICERQPEDLLVLACEHNLCISCATQMFVLNGEKNPFVCEICLVETELDRDAINLFQTQSTQRYSPRQTLDHSHSKTSKPPKMEQSRMKQETKQMCCKIHNEPCIYFCFNCNTSDICSECILTQKHNSHKVVTIKKAMATFNQKVQDQLKMCEDYKKQLEQQYKQYSLNKNSIKKQYDRKKNQVKFLFDNISRVVADKYAQVSASLQEQLMKAEQIYDACLAEIAEKQKVLNDTIKIQKKSVSSKSSNKLPHLLSNFVESKNIFEPELPESLPICNFELKNSNNICQQIEESLSKLTGSSSDMSEYSQIRQIDNHIQEPIKTALKQSCRVSINQSNNRLASSRKLQMNKSIQNATYIINRLQERSKKF